MVDQPVGPGNVAMQAPTGHLEIEVGQYLVQQQPATRTSAAGAAAAGRACLTAVLPAGAITLLGAYLCEVLGGHPNLSALSGLLVTASFVYALDRFVLHPEDPADVRQSRPLFGWMLAIAALAQAALAAAVPKLAWGIVWGDLFGSAYALRFPVWRCRLKAVPFLKTAYTPFVIVSTTLLLLRIPALRRRVGHRGGRDGALQPGYGSLRYEGHSIRSAGRHQDSRQRAWRPRRNSPGPTDCRTHDDWSFDARLVGPAHRPLGCEFLLPGVLCRSSIHEVVMALFAGSRVHCL